MRLLLHVCCGPCSTQVIEELKKTHDLTLYFYDPNIQPREEYERRLEAAMKVAEVKGIPLIIGSYDEPEWREAVKGLEDEPENGKRCHVCYEFRLMEAARMCRELHCDAFTTTLTISPYKDAAVINRIGEKAAQAFGVGFLASNFKKKDGFLKSTKMSAELGIYRQHYCGCQSSIASPKE